MTIGGQKNNHLLNVILEGIQHVKGENISIINLTTNENRLADYYIICSADSSTQVSAVARSVEEFTLKFLKEKPWHVEGKDNGQWVLMDYITCVVHIFQPDLRSFYDIEGLWNDNEIKSISEGSFYNL